jgi:hypothetical protein
MDGRPKYMRFGCYIVSLDYIHGVFAAMTESEDIAFQIFITYTDKTSIGIECKDVETKDMLMDKISKEIGAI